ncbi:MAG: archaellin/type IV pilin N-terminal domain-containing protein [Candidatus Woesearchaeota archaeon]
MKKGESGVGTLIIFIAMLLVAAIAAGVLIQTTGALQNKAMVTGQQAKSQISTHVELISITGTNGSIASSIQKVSMIMKLSAGSEMINLQELTTIIDTKSASSTFSFPSYTILYLQNGTDHKDNYIAFGDLVKVEVTLPTNITKNEKVTISVIPKMGLSTRTDIVTPSDISNYIVHLYP